MKHYVRSFSIGLFTAGILMLLTIFISGYNGGEQATTEQMITRLEAQDYQVLTMEDYTALTNQANETRQQAVHQSHDKTEKASEHAAQNTQPDTENRQTADSTKEISFVLHIQPGGSTEQISSTLEENQIIESAEEFNNYLREHDFSRQIQVGSFQLSSAMSFFEIAAAITN